MVVDPEYREGLRGAKREKIATDAANGGAAGVSANAADATGGKRKRDESNSSSSSSSSNASADEVASPKGRSSNPPTVDATLFCVVADEWDEAYGGYTSYLTSDDELLTVIPKQVRCV